MLHLNQLKLFTDLRRDWKDSPFFLLVSSLQQQKKNWDSCDASLSKTQPLLPNCLQIFRRFPCVCPTFVPIRWGTHAEM